MRVLFFIHDLGQGGAEKVLVNLVNHMDPGKFDISVLALFGGGVNEQFLAGHVHYRAVFPRMIPGNSHLMKLFSPSALHRLFVRGRYDVEIAYLEGPDARIISGGEPNGTKRLAWIHSMQMTEKQVSASFRSLREAEACYRRFDRIVAVAGTVRDQFLQVLPTSPPVEILYNTNDSYRIRQLAEETPKDGQFSGKEICLVGIGKLVPVKGFDRLLRIVRRLTEEGYPVHLYLLGEGPERERLEAYVRDNNMVDSVSFLGYQTNPYCYVSRCDLYVCSSYSEGFSTAATEALIVGTPVCTTDVSGMKEMLGKNNEYGIVTENSEEALYSGIKSLLDDPAQMAVYKERAINRGGQFSTEKTIQAVESLLECL